jgi:tetratricopeptide (TPR) repeat protein
MKHNILKICSGLTLIAGLISLSSCGSDFLETTPTNQVSTNSIWTSENLAERAVNGIYGHIYYEYRDNPWITLWDGYTEIMDEDVNWVSGNAPILRGSATASSGMFSTWWKRLYEGISRANDVLANISKVPDMSDEDKARYIAEAKFLRAWEYYRLNCLWQGVPVYTEPVAADEATKGRSTTEEVFSQIIQDCTDAINEPNLPDKYSSSDANWGRVTKGAAYMLRAKTYLWLERWAEAEADFKKITGLGYKLFDDYYNLFTENNEKNDEYIFVYQYMDESGLGNFMSWTFGNRCSSGYSWNNYLPNPYFVDSYQNADGSAFNIDDVIPGYSSMTPQQRIVYYLRDNMTDDEISNQTNVGADMTKYLPNGNEARIKKVYEGRDPRMAWNFILPYSTYVGGATGTEYTYTLRWPYRGYDSAKPFDLRTDTNDRYYYLWRKFVFRGREHTDQNNSPIDIPIFRYAETLIGLAEALNEQGKTEEAITYLNQVRERAGVSALNSNEHTRVTGQADLRERIRNEYGWELCGENVTYFNELRWGTWHQKKFVESNGMTEIWGTKKYTNSWQGDYCVKWAIPQSEVEKNENLKQNDGWY